MSADTQQADVGDRVDVDAGREPLQATVVRYRDSPDRCTLAPADVDDDRRLTAWLSVNADAMVPPGDSRRPRLTGTKRDS